MDKIKLLEQLKDLLLMLQQKQSCADRGYLIYINYEIDILKELLAELDKE